MQKIDLKDRLWSFIESEGKSCSMDIGGITPEYVFRMWGGQVPFETIEETFRIYGSRLTGNS